MKGKGQSNMWQRSSIKALVLVAIFACVLLVAIRGARCTAKRKLAEGAEDLSSELLDFSNSRAQLTAKKANESFQLYRNRVAAEDSTTQSLYLKLYSSRVAAVRDQLASRGLSDRDFDAFYKTPADPLAIRDIGERLLDMGKALHNP